jgi:amino acid transporter
VRAIGVRGLAANIVNTTVGADIFVLRAPVAGDLGTAAPLGYLACAFAMTLVVASFAMARYLARRGPAADRTAGVKNRRHRARGR